MKILLINEASGVHRYLKCGLQELGHSVVHVSSYRLSSQKREVDLYLGNEKSNILDKIQRNIPLFWYSQIKPFGKFDVVNYILSLTCVNAKLLRYQDIVYFKRAGSLLSYYGLGCDAISLPRIREDMQDLPCPSCLNFDYLGTLCEKHYVKERKNALKYTHYFDFCVSALEEYSHCHKAFPNATHDKIPIPINVNLIPFWPASNLEQPIIVHAPTRRGFKGTDIILKAIDILKKRGIRFQFELIENMSHEEYLRTLQKADILIDQVHSYSPGVSALEALAMGKIVLSGNSVKMHEYYDFGKKSPVLNASANENLLADSIISVIENRNYFKDYPSIGRRYVEVNHGHVKIAIQFAKLWKLKYSI